ncbi:MAG TPA: hypothetical protein DCM45_04615, partial [Clostridiales bacterium]|nr:hypothetical protein [Clostridiales bacterium]
EGGRVQLIERITSAKFLPLPWLTVKFQVSRHLVFPDKLHAAITDDYYREDLFSLGIYQRISRTLDVELARRGYYSIKSIDLLSSDLLLSVKLVGHAASLSCLTVCPRLIGRGELDIPYRQLIGTALTRQALLADPFEFRTIREYQGFDHLKSVNWLATARTGQLKVNVHEYTTSREIRVLLNIEPDGAFYEEMLLEEAIRLAASLCNYALEDGISCSMRSNARDVLTQDAIDLPAGQTLQHNDQIQEQLGRLNLALPPESFAALLTSERAVGYSRPVLVMISLNCSPAICKNWQTCLDNGSQGIWIVPRLSGQPARMPEITGPVHVWEVNHVR